MRNAIIGLCVLGVVVGLGLLARKYDTALWLVIAAVLFLLNRVLHRRKSRMETLELTKDSGPLIAPSPSNDPAQTQSQDQAGNIIETLVTILKEYPNVQYDFREDAIRVLPANDNGYEVSLLIRADGGYTVCFETWHMEFSDVSTAGATFMGGLSPFYRLKVARKGAVDYRWTIQYRTPTGWIDGSTVAIFQYPFWRKKQVRYLQNNLTPLPEDSESHLVTPA